MSECPHKQLKKQLVGEQVWYVCECGQKFKAEPWDGRVVVLAEAQEAQFNEHAQNCPKCWATLRHGSRDVVCDKGAAILAKEICEAERERELQIGDEVYIYRGVIESVAWDGKFNVRLSNSLQSFPAKDLTRVERERDVPPKSD